VEDRDRDVPVSVRERLARRLASLYIWATCRLYHECAWAYDAVSWIVSAGQWADWRRRTLDYVIGRRVLELGFGTGELLIEAAHQGLEAYGLEPSREMQRITARKARREASAIPRVQAVAQRMPFRDGSFGDIFSTFPAGYILDPATLHEVARLLRPPETGTGGRAGQFIVVGLYVQDRGLPLDRVLHLLFGGSSERALESFRRIASTAGLSIRVALPGDGQPGGPAIIAEPCAAGVIPAP
jgi:SAM-dependent methyltransferase